MRIISFKNLGNTCYLNSVFICFIYTHFFHEKIREVSGNESVFLSEMRNIIRCINLNEQENKNIIYDLSSFINYFISEKPWFKRFQQNDAHEFLINFLELLIKSSPVIYKLRESDEPWKKSWNSFLSKNSSPFTREYHGQSKTKIKCCKCKTSKNIFDEFNSINLTVPLNETSLDKLFENYLKMEVQDDQSNLYYCETCKKNKITMKKIFLNILPNKLIIVLKRYSCTGTKIITEIEYPEELVIKESSSQEIKKYKLYAIVNHQGNLYDGHYTTNIKLKDTWYYFDDDLVFLNKSLNMKNPNAYILFYMYQ